MNKTTAKPIQRWRTCGVDLSRRCWYRRDTVKVHSESGEDLRSVSPPPPPPPPLPPPTTPATFIFLGFLLLPLCIEDQSGRCRNQKERSRCRSQRLLSHQITPASIFLSSHRRTSSQCSSLPWSASYPASTVESQPSSVVSNCCIIPPTVTPFLHLRSAQLRSSDFQGYLEYQSWH